MKKKSVKSRRLCEASAPEAEICKTAKELTGLFNRVEIDAPDALLSHSPAPKNTVDALRVLLDVMFPGKISATPVDASELGIFLVRRLSEAWRLLRREIRRALPYRWIGEAARVEGARPPKIDNLDRETDRILQAFIDTLPGVRRLLVADVQAAYDGDPAATSLDEVILAYPGLLAITVHRVAHELYRLGVPLMPRIMSEWAHARSGVDIHPGATIGGSFFIDHATGVVIGETTDDREPREAVPGRHARRAQLLARRARPAGQAHQAAPDGRG